MSGPGVGYPDYQAYPNARNILTVSGIVTVPPAGLDLGTFQFSNYASMRLIASTTQGGLTLDITGTDANALAFISQSILCDLTSVNALDLIIPAPGQSVDFFVNNNTASGKQFNFAAEAVQIPLPGIASGAGSQLTGEQNIVLASGAQHFFTPTLIIPGKAFLHYQCFTAAAASEVFVESLDSLGNFTHDLFSQSGSALIVNQELDLPLAPIQIGVANQSGGNITFSWSLTQTGVT